MLAPPAGATEVWERLDARPPTAVAPTNRWRRCALHLSGAQLDLGTHCVNGALDQATSLP